MENNYKIQNSLISGRITHVRIWDPFLFQKEIVNRKMDFWFWISGPNLPHTQNKLPTPYQAIIKTDGIKRANPSISLACPMKQKEGREQMVQ